MRRIVNVMNDQSWLQHLSTAVHNLKSPLSAVSTLLDGIENVGELNEKQQYFADRARAKVSVMTNMIGMILELAWLEAENALNLSDVDVLTLVAITVDVLAENAAQRQIEVRVTEDDSVGLIRADAHQLEQALMNLVSNALKFNHDSGWVQITVTGEADQVRVRVQDGGRGIPPEDQPFVFNRFYRSKASIRAKIDGSGLGLALVKAVIDKHHGRIWVESEPGQGTIFTFTLPRSPETALGKPEQTAGRKRRRPQREGDEMGDGVDDHLQESHDKSGEAADSHAGAGRKGERRKAE